MTSFKDKILASAKIRAVEIDASSFISNLRAKQAYESNRKKRIRSGFSAFAFIFLISIITFNQLENFDNYNSYVPFAYDESEVYFEILDDQSNESIINDNDFIIRDAMEKWSNSINDLQTAQGTINPEVYQRSALVKQLSRQGTGPGDDEKILRQYKFEGIYPNTVSSIPLDFGATDQIEEFQVTFNYLFYEVAGGADGTGTKI